jgi:hypothetical protein
MIGTFLKLVRSTAAVALLFPTVMLAAERAVPELSPMPFRAGTLVSVSTRLATPYSDLSAYVSVRTSAGTILFDQIVPLGSVPPGKQKLADFTLPRRSRAGGVTVFVALLHGDELYVGEPGQRSYNFIRRCRGAGPTTSCAYATAKYWTITTPVN